MQIVEARVEGDMHGVCKNPSTGRGEEEGDCGESCGVEEERRVTHARRVEVVGALDMEGEEDRAAAR